jgi:hypothetical protein
LGIELLLYSVISGTAPKIISETSKLVNRAKDHLGLGSVPDSDEQQESLPDNSEDLHKRVDALESILRDQTEIISQMAEQGQAIETDLDELAKRVRLLQLLGNDLEKRVRLLQLLGVVIVLVIVVVIAAIEIRV